MGQLLKKLDLQAKISFVLAAVILPTFLIVTIAQHQVTLPILEEDIKQVAINSGKALATEIARAKLLARQNPNPAVENALQDILYAQPNITRIDVFAKDPISHEVKTIASNMEEEPGSVEPTPILSDSIVSELKGDDGGGKSWEISVPIESHGRDVRGPKRLLGNVRIVASTQGISRIGSTLWKITATAAALSVVCLILVLRYFLKKTIANDRKLRRAETQNIELTEQLHEAHRQLMNSEKLAVMGQLTASFAHEIGTPLNAIGGHLFFLHQFLRDELGGQSPSIQAPSIQAPSVQAPSVQAPSVQGEEILPQVEKRIDVMAGQLDKIESIVKSFLQSTSKPISQKQLVDLNRLVDKTLGILHPRIDSMGIRLKRDFDRALGPLRVVPLDLEQILLNLLSNSLDSIQTKNRIQERGHYHLILSTLVMKEKGREWAQISVFDRGEGIKKSNLPEVLKPFFTTKRPGDGTGLGLTICQELTHKYGGKFLIDSKEGAWTRVTMRLPYHPHEV